MSRPEGRDLARVLARKAKGDAKAMRRLASDSEIDDEAVGFHAQQAIEKWIKAVMAFHGLEEVRIHDLGHLLEILRDTGVELPPDGDGIDELTIYAVPMRYDELLDAEPLERDAAIALVESRGMGDHPTRLKLCREFVPDSTELSRTLTERIRSGTIRLYRRLPARLIIRRSKVRVLPVHCGGATR